jgi:S-adenosylmethionine:tRNA ribosyltransferase-isomerase
MKTTDFDYTVPQELIAQYPCEKRDECRLLCLNRNSRTILHHTFKDISGLLKPGDRLVFNNTKVVPARIMCIKDTGANIELLFTDRINALQWRTLAKPAKRIPKGTILTTGVRRNIRLHVDDTFPDGSRLISLLDTETVSTIDEMLMACGSIPLPPYIKRKASAQDRTDYQTVFALKPGAIACPTAGLHFTESLQTALKDAGINSSYLTLHVGLGTFKPVTEQDPLKHIMHEEAYTLPQSTVDEIIQTKKNGNRVIAVGTTVVRVLEHCSRETGYPVASTGRTSLMILPGHTFNAIDGMITNFHVPQSTLLMLVSAFAGKDFIFDAYNEAIRQSYRFFSYGDAMLII